MAESLEFVFPGETKTKTSSVGQLIDEQSNQMYSSDKRFTAHAGDVVIGLVTFKTADFYRVDIRGCSSAMLGTTAFNGATKRHKPDIRVGQYVAAWIQRVDVDLGVELSCEDPATQRDWSSGDCNFGVLPTEISDHTLVFDISVSYAANLQIKQDTHPVLRSLARLVDKAEIVLGKNGRVFVRTASREQTLAVVKTVLLGERLKPVQIEALLKALLLQATHS